MAVALATTTPPTPPGIGGGAGTPHHHLKPLDRQLAEMAFHGFPLCFRFGAIGLLRFAVGTAAAGGVEAVTVGGIGPTTV